MSFSGSNKPRQSAYNSPPPSPPPIIPTSWLAPHEQRWFFVSLFGLVECTKVWDIIAPYFISSPEPTWSAALRVRGPITALGWTGFEVGLFAGVALLRIPMLSPSGKQLMMLSIGLIAWNLVCWFLAEPGQFFRSIHLIGPTALGAEWYWNWFYAIKRWREPSHLAGVHKIRLLPYSTATLNPLSLSYCIPPDASQPLYIPIVFNNSLPHEISYFVRSLETGHAEVKSIYGSSLKPPMRPKSKLALTDGDDDEDEMDEPEIDPLSALVLRSEELDIAKLPSVKPSDSLSLAPPKLASTQQVLFLSVDRPSVVSLKSVTDKRGDKFHIAPHREAVIIECPSGGHFVDQNEGQLIPRPTKPQPAELRCQGTEETVQFQARGVAPLRAGWKKRSKDTTSQGIIEGIESKDDTEIGDFLALVRKDKVAKTHTVPLRVQHDQPGVFTVSLTSVHDSMHNTYTPSGHAAEKVFNVIPRPSARLVCAAPKELLVGQKSTISIQLEGVSTEAVELIYTFTGIDGSMKSHTISTKRKQETIPISEPGTYALSEVNGPCGGTISEPSSCLVQLIPKPSLDMTVQTLHECAMDVGATASIDFSGSPPFVVEYTEQRNKNRPITRTARFNGHSGDIVLTPAQEGEYTYTFVSLSDAKYNQVKLEQPPIKQTVHPLASVELLGPRKQRLYACSGDELEVAFEGKGANPLSLSYHVSYNGQTTNGTWQGAPGRQSMRVPVPQALTAEAGGSGKMTITLLSIEDGNGCARKLPAPTIDVQVNRQRPTLRFAQSERVVITEGETVRAPLRLTGTGPWEVVYSVNGKRKTATMRDPNNALTFTEKGTYELLQVKDANCPGDVLGEPRYEIDFKPRPSVRLGTPGDEGKGLQKRTGCCAGQEDQVAFVFEGQAPFELSYSYSVDGKVSKHTLKSAQNTGVLRLAIEPGVHRYDFMELKDANYPKNPVHIAVDHIVHSRPSVSFIKTNARPVCLDSLISGDAKLKLTGQAPFDMEISVRKPASSRVEIFHIFVKGQEWTLDVPYTVKDVGRHEITVTSLKDFSGCAWDIRDGDVLSTTVEVVESARIVPVSAVTDLCVGDTLDFLLQGKAPWTVEYEWLGKSHKVSSSASRFSRYAEYPGKFSVKSVALKDNQCKRQIKDMERHVHPLPSVKIQEGISALREGDEPAAFSVAFTGTAPFSFTYTRSELIGTKYKVVETQTVTDIMEDNYSISSSLPGDYAVTSVSDKYCRYPPLTKGREGK